MIKERALKPAPGLVVLLGALVLLGLSIWWFAKSAQTNQPTGVGLSLVGIVAAALLIAGIFAVYPNESKVLTLFGRYVGTVKEAGLWFANPFTIKKKISVRIRNFETGKLKVNDNSSNPIEIGAVVVWQVVDTAEALFEVDDYDNFVKIQSEAALRVLAQSYVYDAHEEGQISLSGNAVDISHQLMGQVQERLAKAGVQVLEARISHLAYAAEIAHAMLQRQQASAIIAARQKIVEGAVGMVENALEMLSRRDIVHLDDERRAAMVSNLLVVLCSERGTQPIVNTGTLYT